MTPQRNPDHDAIEATLMGTAQGRSFLVEVKARASGPETAVLLRAIERLERVMREDRRGAHVSRFRDDLLEMSSAIERTRSEIASIRQSVGEPGRIEEATEELDAVVRATEQATSDILEVAEAVQEIGSALREGGADGAACDGLDNAATAIFTACSFQDLTGQRTRKVVQLLRYLETRIASMIDIWGEEAMRSAQIVPDASDARPDAHLLHGPAREGEGISQASVDSMFVDSMFEEAAEAGSEPSLPVGDPAPVRLVLVHGAGEQADRFGGAPPAEETGFLEKLGKMTPAERLALFS